MKAARPLVYGERSMLISCRGARLAFRTWCVCACLALGACGTGTEVNPVAAKDACTVEAVMVPIREALDTADTEATVAENNGDLKCAAGIARITVLLGAVSAPADSAPGSPHLVLLEDEGGSWAIANDKLCTGTQPARTIPPELGEVCGVQ